jgi:hypothetical protein
MKALQVFNFFFQLNIPPKTSLPSPACSDPGRAILQDSPFPSGMALPYLARLGNLESLYATSPMTPNALGVEPSAFYPLVSFNFHAYKIKFQWYQIIETQRVQSDLVEKIWRYSIMSLSDLLLFVSLNLPDFFFTFFFRFGCCGRCDIFHVKHRYQVSCFTFSLEFKLFIIFVQGYIEIPLVVQTFNKLLLFKQFFSLEKNWPACFPNPFRNR